ncbi:MAG: hypothetical protein Q9220_002961 [cf. Caloplaca sp. 1 TL-2023]
MDVNSLARILVQRDNNIIETVIARIRHDSLEKEEEQQTEEKSKFSKYTDNYPLMGEDLARNLKAIKSAKNQSRQLVHQAERASEQSARSIAEIILNTKPEGIGHTPMTVEIGASRRTDQGSCTDPAITVLKQDVDNLRLSVVKATSDHNLINEVASHQHSQAEEIATLRRESIRRNEGKFIDLPDQVKELTSHVSKQDEVKKDLESRQNKKVDSLKADVKDDFKKLKNEVIELNRKHGSAVSIATKLETDIAVLREDFNQQSQLDMKHTMEGLKDRIESTESRFAIMKETVEDVQRDLQSQSGSLLELKEQNHDKTMFQLQDLQEKQSSALKAMDKGLEHNLDKSNEMQSSLQGLQIICEEGRKLTTDCIEQSQNVLHEQQELKNRMDLIEREGKELMTCRPSPTQIADQNGLMRSQLAKDFIPRAEFDERGEIERTGEVARDAFVGNELEDLHRRLTQQESFHEDLKVQITDREMQLKAQKEIIERFKSDQLANSEFVRGLEAELQRVKQHLEKLQSESSARRDLQNLESELSLLKDKVSQQPPHVNGVNDDHKPKIEALESDVRVFNNKVIAIESFQVAQEQRWNNLTTEPIITTVFAKIQQTYPLPYIHGTINTVNRIETAIAQLVSNIDAGRSEELKRFGGIEKIVQDLHVSLNKTITNNASSLEAIEQLRHLNERCGNNRKEDVARTTALEQSLHDNDASLRSFIKSVGELRSIQIEESKNWRALDEKMENIGTTIEAIKDRRQADRQGLDDTMKSTQQLETFFADLRRALDDFDHRFETIKLYQPGLIEQIQQSITKLDTDTRAANEQALEQSRNSSESSTKTIHDLEDRLAKEEELNREWRRGMEDKMQQKNPPPPILGVSPIIPAIFEGAESSEKQPQTLTTKPPDYVSSCANGKSDVPSRADKRSLEDLRNGSIQEIDEGQHALIFPSADILPGPINDIEALKNRMSVLEMDMEGVRIQVRKIQENQPQTFENLSKKVEFIEKAVESLKGVAAVEEVKSLKKDIEGLYDRISHTDSKISTRVARVSIDSHAVNENNQRRTKQEGNHRNEDSIISPEKDTGSEYEPDDPPPLSSRNRRPQPARASTNTKDPKKRTYADHTADDDDDVEFDSCRSKSPQLARKAAANPSPQIDSPRRGRPPKKPK